MRIFGNALLCMVVSLGLAQGSASPEQQQTTGPETKLLCNGYSELCSRSYNNVSFACTHNAYSSPPPEDYLALNQARSIQEQLDDGVRAFMLDVVRSASDTGTGSNTSSASSGIVSTIINKFKGIFSRQLHHKKESKEEDPTITTVHLCHESCLLVDKGRLVDTLAVFKKFMDANPHEVVTFIIENVSGFTATQLSPSFEQSGLDKYAYAPGFSPRSSHSGYAWPTLAELIDKNKRLVVFIDDKADTSAVPYILPEWEYVVEIPYANINPVKSFPCNQERPRDAVPRDLLVLNHFAYNRITIAGKNIDSPLNPTQVEEHGYNSLKSLSEHLSSCKSTWGSRVFNFITVDFYDIGAGGIFKAVKLANGLS
ncbi:hypothetical protein GGI11_003761 [Coemansia sp. RSA 2049]|nr:hypothetical protein GGI11_003761 [Coemansia sp. RSA 2049]